MELINHKFLEHVQYSYEENYIYILYQDDSLNGVGSIFKSEDIRQDTVDSMHQNGKIVCVSGEKQTEQFYRNCYNRGVDMIITDQPRKAHETL